MNLDKIRSLEGQFDIREPTRTITVPQEDKLCAFAHIMAYKSKLFSCGNKQLCPEQITYGTSQRYCRRELEKPTFEQIQIEKYGEEAIKQMQDRI